MSKKRKRNGGTAEPIYATMHIDGVAHKKYTLETSTTFLMQQMLSVEQLDELRRAAKTAQANAISDWLQAKLGQKPTHDVREYLQQLAPVTGRLNS